MSKSQTFTAGCSAVGGFGYAGNFTLYVVLTDRDGNPGTNVSQVDYNVYCQSNGSGSINAKHYKYFSINGSEKINTTEQVNVSSNYAYISIASGTISVTHNNDGSATIPFSAQIKANNYGVSASVSGNFELEKIARYTTVWNSMRGKTLNTISVNWSTSDARDWTQYSLNGGSWTDALDTVASDNKSGYYTVSGLNPNTKYTIKTRCRRADSALWSEASTLTITTYDMARITEAPNFTDEQSPTIKYTNPFGNNVTSLQACISLTGAKDDIAYRDISKTGTSYTFNLTDAERNVLRKAATKNTLSVHFFIRTTYSKTYPAAVTRMMSIVNANPVFSNFTYQDTDSSVIALTGNNQTIVKGYSNVKGIVSTANKATAQKSATMSKYRLAIGEKTAEVAYSSSAEKSVTISDVASNSFTMYAIDSRGNSTGKTITASTYINYTPITITSISVVRTNSVNSETTLKFSGKIWNGSFGSVTNSIKSCSYKYKLSSASSWTAGTTTITPTKSGGTFSFTGVIAGDSGANGFNINNSYNIQVLIADQLSNNNSNPATFTLGPGTPAIAIYKNNVAIGKKYDTSDGSKLQVNGNTLITGSETLHGRLLLRDSPPNFGGTREETVSGSYVKLFTYTMTSVYKNTSIWFTLCDTQSTNENLLCNLYARRGSADAGISVTTFSAINMRGVSFNKNRLVAVITSTSTIEVYFKMVSNDSPAISILSMTKLREANNAYGKITIDCSTTVTSLPSGTQKIVSFDKIDQVIHLYSNSSGTTGTVTLSETAANFVFLEIFYKNSVGGEQSVKVYSPNGQKITLTSSFYDGAFYVFTRRVTISGTSITNNDYGQTWFSNGGTANNTSENKIYIVQVIGYK